MKSTFGLMAILLTGGLLVLLLEQFSEDGDQQLERSVLWRMRDDPRILFMGQRLDRPLELKDVQVVELTGMTVTAAIVREASDLPRLGKFLAKDCTFSDDCAQEFWGFENLDTFVLIRSHGPFDRIFEHLRWGGFVSFHDMQITGETIRQLSRVRGVYGLHLPKCRVTPEVLQFITAFRELTDLTLRETDIDDGSLEFLPRCERLTKLNLSQTAVTDKVVETLRQCRNLKELHINGTAISPEAIGELVVLPSLKLVSAYDLKDDAYEGPPLLLGKDCEVRRGKSGRSSSDAAPAMSPRMPTPETR